MQTRDAVEAMMAIMKNEELYGRPDMPVWIERTAVGSSVQALIQCLTQLDIKGELAGRQGMQKDQLEEAWRTATQRPHGFLWISYNAPVGEKLWSGFTKRLMAK